METITVELELSPDQYGELVAVAHRVNGRKVKRRSRQARSMNWRVGKR